MQNNKKEQLREFILNELRENGIWDEYCETPCQKDCTDILIRLAESVVNKAEEIYGTDDRSDIVIINQFCKKIGETKEIEPDIQEVINNHFFDML